MCNPVYNNDQKDPTKVCVIILGIQKQERTYSFGERDDSREKVTWPLSKNKQVGNHTIREYLQDLQSLGGFSDDPSI